MVSGGSKRTTTFFKTTVQKWEWPQTWIDHENEKGLIDSSTRNITNLRLEVNLPTTYGIRKISTLSSHSLAPFVIRENQAKLNKIERTIPFSLSLTTVKWNHAGTKGSHG